MAIPKASRAAAKAGAAKGWFTKRGAAQAAAVGPRAGGNLGRRNQKGPGAAGRAKRIGGAFAQMATGLNRDRKKAAAGGGGE